MVDVHRRSEFSFLSLNTDTIIKKSIQENSPTFKNYVGVLRLGILL